MADFIGALSEGLAAANKLDADRREVDSVVSDASKQLHEATDGGVGIAIREFDKQPTSSNSTSRIAEMLAASIAREKFEGLAFVFKNGGVEKASLLAMWTTNKGGYPVKLQHAGIEISCHDKAGLEEGLTKVLSSPLTGQRLRVILSNAGMNSLSRPKPASRRKSQ